MGLEDKLSIKLNQNLWGCVIGFGAVGVAERWGLKSLFWPGWVLAWGLTASVLITTLFYTVSYCAHKWRRTTGTATEEDD